MDSQQIMTAISTREMSGPQILQAAKTAWRSYQQAGWLVAKLLVTIRNDALWRQDRDTEGKPYSSLTAWACGELGVTDHGRVSHLCSAGEMALADSRVESVSVSAAEEAARLPDQQQAIATALEGRTQAAVRRLVHEIQLGAVSEHEWRTVSARVTEGTASDWRRCLNVVRVHLGESGTAFPTDDDLLRYVAQTVLQAPELQVPDQWRVDVESGLARCARCQSFAYLEQHHVTVDAHGGVEHPAWLCHVCRQAIAEGVSGWRIVPADLVA